MAPDAETPETCRSLLASGFWLLASGF